MCKGEVKPDGRIYNVMIHGNGKAGRVDRAFELYQDMRKLQLNISVVTFNSLLACQKNIRDAESIFRQVKAFIQQHIIFYGLVSLGFEWPSLWALLFFEKLGGLVSFEGRLLKIYGSWFDGLLDNVDCRDRVPKSGKLRSGSEGLMEPGP